MTWNNVTAGDFDGDGRTDIAGRAGGQWWVARSTGGAFANQLWGGWADVAWRDVHAAAFTFNPSQSETAAPTSNAADDDIALAAALTTSNPQKDSKTALAAVFADWNEELAMEAIPIDARIVGESFGIRREIVCRPFPGPQAS